MEEQRSTYRRCEVCGRAKALKRFERTPSMARRRVCRECRSRRRHARRLALRGDEVPSEYRDPDLSELELQRKEQTARAKREGHSWGR